MPTGSPHWTTKRPMTHTIASLLDLPGKNQDLAVLGREPFVADTPEELLDDETTPVSKFFIRNNGLTPEPVGDAEAWEFVVDGEVARSLRLSVGELKRRFRQKTLRMVLECGGNGRSLFEPKTPGNPWTNGGGGGAERNRGFPPGALEGAGVAPSARFTPPYRADPHVSGAPGSVSISRGMPIAKALDEHTLLVFAMNGKPLPFIHGGPLRLLVPGWPGSLSQKWLTRIWIRDREHDGPGMTGTSYRVPVDPMAPGQDPKGVVMRILESMPVRSIVSCPADGAVYPAGTREIEVRGAAWAGDDAIARVEISADSGATWREAVLRPPHNRYDWVRWSGALTVPADGQYEIRARATDRRGRAQPQ